MEKAPFRGITVDKNPLQIAFDMGARAFQRGMFDSPYKEGTVLLKEWHRGFNTAYFANIDKLTAAEKAA